MRRADSSHSLNSETDAGSELGERHLFGVLAVCGTETSRTGRLCLIMAVRERERDDHKCPLDANIYATRKTVAQGMMDIALLTANASQLKHVLATADTHDYYLINLVLIGCSMMLQILVGILLVVVGRWNINMRKEQNVANVTNNIIVILIFLITVINVLITAFGDEDPDYNQSASHFAAPRKELVSYDSPYATEA